MSDGETPAEPLPSPTVPPASRLGTILGWGLLALGVTCLIASLWVGISAESAWRVAQARPVDTIPAFEVYKAAEAAHRDASVLAYLLLGAGFLSLSSVSGLFYAFRPRLLGGPLGFLLRMASLNAARYHGLQQPTTFYQGLYAAVQGAGTAIFALVAIVMTLDPAAFWLVFPAMLLWPAAYVWSFALLGGSWWFTSGRR